MTMRFLMTIALVMSLASAERLNGQQSAAPAVPMTLDVDATDAPMKILHATMTMPARAGAMALFYPKWIPGEHMPSGPIANLTGLHVFADNAELTWRRDLVEMNAFRLQLHAPLHHSPLVWSISPWGKQTCFPV